MLKKILKNNTNKELKKPLYIDHMPYQTPRESRYLLCILFKTQADLKPKDRESNYYAYSPTHLS